MATAFLERVAVLSGTIGPRQFYRYLTPRWVWLPLTGPGAASAGEPLVAITDGGRAMLARRCRSTTTTWHGHSAA